MAQNYLSDLNDEQRVAVTAPINEPLFIYAGAGSGKTRTLICRIAYMIDQGVKPENILAMTFTRKAADEIRDRIKTFIGPKALTVCTSTFHQFCLNVLKQNPFILGFSDNDGSFHIADNSEQRKIVKNAVQFLRQKVGDRRDLQTPNQLKILTNKMLSFINKAKMQLKDSSHFTGDYQIVFKSYEDQLKKRKLIDFTDFLTYTRDLFLRHQSIAQKYRKQFQYILIDEFQDTSDLNFTIMNLLLHQSMSQGDGPNRCVTIVGDPHQSIYSFRGANPDNINQFFTLFPDARCVTLSTNYRSTESIVSFSQSLIRNDKTHLISGESPPLTAVNKGGLRPKLIIANDAYSEAEQICTEIERIVFPGSQFQYRDVCVMFRLRKVSSELEMELFRRNIPYTHKRGVSFFLRPEIQEVISYSRLLLSYNSEDTDANQLLASSFQIAIMAPDRGIRAAVTTKIKEDAQKRKMNVMQYLHKVIKGEIKTDIPKTVIKKLSEFDEILAKLHKQICVYNRKMSTDTVLQQILTITKLYDRSTVLALDKDDDSSSAPAVKVKSSPSDNAENYDLLDDFNDTFQDVMQNRQETIQLLIEEARRFHMRQMQMHSDQQEESQSATQNSTQSELKSDTKSEPRNSTQSQSLFSSESNLRKFIASITLEASGSSVKNAVTLTTIHQMKGLESPVCFLMRFNEGVLPMNDNDSRDETGLLDTPVSLPEERRIAYVAMTRAKQRLYITCSLAARGRSCEPSQFLGEVDSHFLTRDVPLTEEEKREVEEAMKYDDSSSEFEFEKERTQQQQSVMPM